MDQQVTHRQQSTHSSHNSHQPKRRMPLWSKITAAVVTLGLIALTVYLVAFRPSLVDSDAYQAVVLTNGDVYFGKLVDYHTDNPSMSEVYYFQAPTATEDSEESVRTLQRLTDESYLPEDKLILNPMQIQYVLNLSEDSEIVSLIEDNQ